MFVVTGYSSMVIERRERRFNREGIRGSECGVQKAHEGLIESNCFFHFVDPCHSPCSHLASRKPRQRLITQ